MYGLRNIRFRLGAERFLAMGILFLGVLAGSPQLAKAQQVLIPGERITFDPTAGAYSGDSDAFNSLPCAACINVGSLLNHPLSATVSSVVPLARRTRDESSTFEFGVEEAGAPGRVLPAQISGSVDIRGFMLVIGLAQAKAKVSLVVVDVTDPGSPFSVHCAPIVSYDQTLAEVEFALGISAEGSLGSITVVGATAGGDFEIAIPVTAQVVRESVTFGFPVLLQRGHTYELQLKFSATAKTGVVGGFAMASFSDAFSVLPNVLRPQNWLDPLESVLPIIGMEFPNISASDLGLTSVFTFPALGFHIGAPIDANIQIIPEFDVPLPPLPPSIDGTNDLLELAGLPTNFRDLIESILPVAFLEEEGISPAGVFLKDLSVLLGSDEVGLAEEAKGETLEVINQAKEETLEVIDQNAALALRLRIENNLGSKSEHKGVGLFMLPAEYGGHLELAREILAETISAMVAAGQNIHNANLELTMGDQEVLRGKYKKAYDHYRKSYAAVVQK